jgi:hypothetical protein
MNAAHLTNVPPYERWISQTCGRNLSLLGRGAVVRRVAHGRRHEVACPNSASCSSSTSTWPLPETPGCGWRLDDVAVIVRSAAPAPAVSASERRIRLVGAHATFLGHERKRVDHRDPSQVTMSSIPGTGARTAALPAGWRSTPPPSPPLSPSFTEATPSAESKSHVWPALTQSRRPHQLQRGTARHPRAGWGRLSIGVKTANNSSTNAC